MLRFRKFNADLFDPQPARDVYHKPGPGKGWPEECPPIRAANAFGFDLLANFEVTFTYKKDQWLIDSDIVIESDFNFSGNDESDGNALVQQYAWFWKKGQKLPHVITDNVYDVIKHQVKISTFLYLASDPNELLLVGDLPNQRKPWRSVSALIDTDWYPASYPWHVVLELDPAAKSVTIEKGEPLARITPVRRDTYFAKAMNDDEFGDFFERGQAWIEKHGRSHESADSAATRDITRTYVKQQMRSNFVVME